MEIRDLFKQMQRLLVDDAVRLLEKAKEQGTFISAQDRQAIQKMLKDNGVYLPPEEPDDTPRVKPDLPDFDDGDYE